MTPLSHLYGNPRQLRSRLLRLIVLRAVAVTVLLGSAILVQINAPGRFPVDPFFYVIGFVYALTVLYAVTLTYATRHSWLVDLQLAIDVLVVSFIIYISGGVSSYFASLYVLPIVAASVVASGRAGLVLAGLAATAYAMVILTQYLGPAWMAQPRWLGETSIALPPARVAQFTVGVNAFGFAMVAVLSGYLSENLRQTGTELARVSTEIADLQAFNEHVIDSLTSGLATTDPAGRILTFNRAAEAITGHRAEAVIGRQAGEVLQLPPAYEASLHMSFEEGTSRKADLHYARGDGLRIELGLSAAPLITTADPAGFLFNFQDVTEPRRLEREAALQQRLAAVGEMAAGIAHEIRNPLASMSGSIQILRQELPLTEEQAQLMDIVLRESERLNETISSFLAYARPQRFSTARLDVRGVLNDTAMLLRNSAECGPDHRIDVDVPAHAVWYEADEGQVRQIVWNLATNGLRAMPMGGTLSIAASLEEAAGDSDGADVTLTVSDQGVGIPTEELDGILQPFRGSFTRGTGLGLAIVHRIVSDYRGEIQVTSRVGEGTTVSIRLPGVPVLSTV